MFGVNLVRNPGAVRTKGWLEVVRSARQREHYNLIGSTLNPSTVRETHTRAIIGGAGVDLRSFEGAVAEIIAAAVAPRDKPLAVASANLDHVMHFGAGGRWQGSLDPAGTVHWLTLLDGAPLRTTAAGLTGHEWPRLAGSDLMDPLLDQVEAEGLRVGFLGGSELTQRHLKLKLQERRPGLQVSGWWAPERGTLTSRELSTELAANIARSATDILVVGLGKPRQELWISEYGVLTGAPVMLAFGAVVDFLADRIKRAPKAVSAAGMEWAWRLALEPRRLANRYLVQGPEAYLRMKRVSSVGGAPAIAPAYAWLDPARQKQPEIAPAAQSPAATTAPKTGAFVAREDLAEVTVVLVTYNNVDDISPLLACLRTETNSQSLKVVVADNGSTDGTLDRLAAHTDVILAETGGNLGYAGGINAALRKAGPYHDVLVLNPDLRILPGAIRTLRRRMRVSAAGIVVPKLLDGDGTIYTSLRREPSISKALGDAVFGGRFAGRPEWLSEIDYNEESYHYPHPIDWATGAAVLISGDVVANVGDWDERYFLYSEETDYFRRVRETGRSIWFEPAASMVHSRGGSGVSADLVALMEVNRVRYARAHHSTAYAFGIRVITAMGAMARSYKAGERKACLALFGLHRWNRLLHALPAPGLRLVPVAPAPTTFPDGAVIIPAHNEAAVIARTLRPLSHLAESGAIEVIVACNGCSDTTATIARSFPGVKVLELAEPSKTASLNAADAICTRWPRLYLDADIEATTDAVAAVFEHLNSPDALSARPAFSYDTTGCSIVVKAYYRARARIPSLHEHLWGAGAYAVNAAGHQRFPLFPSATADDVYVDSLFSGREKAILATDPVIVRTPASAKELLKTLRRVYQGKHELSPGQGESNGLGNLLRSINGFQPALDAGVYGSLAILGKLQKGKSRTRNGGWDRDESSRGSQN